MGRADYRGGQAPIKTADQLASLLPIPLFLIVSGYAGPIYPKTDRSNPAPAVGIIGTKTIPDSLKPLASNLLPIWIHWTQWQSVVAPLLDDERVTDWRGTLRDLGDLLDLLVDVYGPNGTIPYPAGTFVGDLRHSTRVPGGLYAPRCGDAQELMVQYSSLIHAQASTAGY
mgnify:CR=1 FL=1|jgi:hypothetical protein